jgi:hypothetical protein
VAEPGATRPMSSVARLGESPPDYVASFALAARVGMITNELASSPRADRRGTR